MKNRPSREMPVELSRVGGESSSEFIELSGATIERFAALYQSVFNGEPWRDGWSQEAVIERLASFAQYPKFLGLGCVVGSKPVALVLGWGERWVGGWQFHIKEMCVASDAQRQHLGAKLLSKFENVLALEGYERVFLETGETAPARMFYESQGYIRIKLTSLAKPLRT